MPTPNAPNSIQVRVSGFLDGTAGGCGGAPWAITFNAVFDFGDVSPSATVITATGVAINANVPF